MTVSTRNTGESSGSDAYFVRVDEHRFMPTVHAGGAWNATEIHFGPLSGLIIHAIERHVGQRSSGELVLSRISFDILGFLASEECEIHVETIRPGRTIELIEATASIAGRIVTRARAWFLSTFDTQSIAGGASEPLMHPDALAPTPLTSVWPGGYVASLDVRQVTPTRPGRATVWLSTDAALIAGEPVSALASWLMLVDTANGIATRESIEQWLYPNVDLSIHLHRQPADRWTGLDTSVVFGATGQGVTSSVLHDLDGPVGFAQQALTVRRQ